jgi:hypothetical protein
LSEAFSGGKTTGPGKGAYRAPIGEAADPLERPSADPRYAVALIDRRPQKEAIEAVLGESVTAATLRGRRLVFVVSGREDDDLMLLMDRLDYELRQGGGVESLPPWPPAWKPDAPPAERLKILMRDIARDTAGGSARFAVARWTFFHDDWARQATDARRLIETLVEGADDLAFPAVFFLIFSGLPREGAADSVCQITRFIEEIRSGHQGRDRIIFLPPPDLIYRNDIVAWAMRMERLCRDSAKAKALRDEGLKRIEAGGSSLRRVHESLLPLVTQVLTGAPAGPGRQA